MADAPIEVRAVRLDDVVREPPALIKIDVEGHEAHVLDGARKILGSARPLLFLELNSLLFLFHNRDVISFAAALWSSFDFQGVFHDETLCPVPDGPRNLVAENIVKHGSVTDLVMRPKEQFTLPSLDEMICSPELLAAKLRISELDAAARVDELPKVLHARPCLVEDLVSAA